MAANTAQFRTHPRILWLSMLPARIKKNQSKMKDLEWSQGFPHYNPMGAILPWKPEF